MIFQTQHERKLWFYVLLIVTGIFSSLFFGRQVLDMFKNQDIRAVIFLAGMLLSGVVAVMHGLRPGREEIIIWLGIAAVYLMVFLRLSLAERSHLIEYSVLAIFIHRALDERMHRKQFWQSGVLAFFITFMVGVTDESLQLLLPDRVFDPVDIVFNGLAALMAVLAGTVVRWGKNKLLKN